MVARNPSIPGSPTFLERPLPQMAFTIAGGSFSGNSQLNLPLFLNSPPLDL